MYMEAIAGKHGLNPFEFRAVTLSGYGSYTVIERRVLIPLNSGQLLCHYTDSLSVCNRRLNPFEFRAVTLSLWPCRGIGAPRLNPFEFRAVTLSPLRFKVLHRQLVLIPLNSGQLLCP